MNIKYARCEALVPDFYNHGIIGIPEEGAVLQACKALQDQQVQTMLNLCVGKLDDEFVAGLHSNETLFGNCFAPSSH